MPYKLRKAPKRDLYWVVGEDGTKHSKDPLPRARAEAQMRALYSAMRKEGSGYDSDSSSSSSSSDEELVGGRNWDKSTNINYDRMY